MLRFGADRKASDAATPSFTRESLRRVTPDIHVSVRS